MIKYILYTFGMSWSLWGTVILGIHTWGWQYGNPLAMTCFISAIFAPGIGAILVNRRGLTPNEFKVFLYNIIDIKKPIKSYAWAVAPPIFMTALPVLTGGATKIHPFYIGFILIIPMIIGGGLEEIGWRGFLQSKLEERYNPLVSTLIIAGIWSIWHIPLWLIPWTNQAEWSFIFFVVNVACFSFLLATVYRKTKSIFLCILCHATINAFWTVFPTNNRILPLIPGCLFTMCLFGLTSTSVMNRQSNNSKG